ncbi:MAG: magnesium transporter CorA family protein [Candidatus Fibromonas sp.]|jgi:magnesium transporter|nr:magnesium transporter CorA family protein [Candidatus Fibromonas sp.]
MLKYYKLLSGRVIPSERSEAQITILMNPGQNEINSLIEDCDLDEHTISSAFDTEELARLEYEDNYTAIIFKKPKSYNAEDHFTFRITSFGIFIYANKVIILSDAELPLADEKRFSRVNSLNMFVLKLLNYSTYHFSEHLRIISRVNDELEAKLVSSMENKYLLYMFGLCKSMVYYLDAISSNQTVLRKLRAGRNLVFTEPEMDLLDDIVIETSQCLRQTENLSNILSSMMDARASIVSNNLNTLMKTLNVLTIGIMVPTFVVSSFSMNIKYPIDTEASWAFWLIMLLVTLCTIGFLLVHKKSKW